MVNEYGASEALSIAYGCDEGWLHLNADWVVLETVGSAYETSYWEWETPVTYEWTVVDTPVDIYQGEEVDVNDSISEQEVASEENYADTESFDMSDAEEDEVASEEDSDEEVASDDEESMEDASDDEGEDVSDEGGDDDGGDDDGGSDMDDGGGDDGD